MTDLRSHVQHTTLLLLRANSYEEEYLCWALGMTYEKILEASMLYNLGVDQTQNEVFDSVALRYAMHLYNRLPGSWHLVRQKLIARILAEVRPARIVEIGFGTPQQYVREAIFRRLMTSENVSIHLSDVGYSSMAFGQSLLSLWEASWSKTVRFRSFAMEYDGKKYHDNCNYAGDYDCYIFQDSIEHVLDPTTYLQVTVSRAPRGAHFLFSLPIEVVKVMPQHVISWRDAGEVQQWLSDAGLSVLFRQEILVDRSVDVFAQKLHPDYRQVVFYCQKPL